MKTQQWHWVLKSILKIIGIVRNTISTVIKLVKVFFKFHSVKVSGLCQYFSCRKSENFFKGFALR